MPSYHIYLATSLPGLSFSAKPPISSQQFLDRCAELIPVEDLEILRAAREVAPDFIYQGNCATIRKWCDFNIALNNEIVKIRASHRHLDAQKYLRPHNYTGFEAAHIVIGAHRNPSLLEGERALDEAGWRYLDELSIGHYFDLDFFIVYLEKLLILERWERINIAPRQELIDSVLTKA